MLRIVLIALLLTTTPVFAVESPALPVSCEEIKRHIAEYGKWVAIGWALKNGFSWSQIKQARKQCHI